MSTENATDQAIPADVPCGFFLIGDPDAAKSEAVPTLVLGDGQTAVTTVDASGLHGIAFVRQDEFPHEPGDTFTQGDDELAKLIDNRGVLFQLIASDSRSLDAIATILNEARADLRRQEAQGKPVDRSTCPFQKLRELAAKMGVAVPESGDNLFSYRVLSALCFQLDSIFEERATLQWSSTTHSLPRAGQNADLISHGVRLTDFVLDASTNMFKSVRDGSILPSSEVSHWMYSPKAPEGVRTCS